MVLAETYTHGKSSVNLRRLVACAMMLPFLNTLPNKVHPMIQSAVSG